MLLSGSYTIGKYIIDGIEVEFVHPMELELKILRKLELQPYGKFKPCLVNKNL